MRLLAYSVGWVRTLGTEKSREVSEGGGAVAVHLELQVRRRSGRESMKEVITDGLAVCLGQGGAERQKKAVEYEWC